MTTMENSRLPVTAPHCGSGSNAQSFASKRKSGEFTHFNCANPECQNAGALIYGPWLYASYKTTVSFLAASYLNVLLFHPWARFGLRRIVQQ